jgi:3',5'-cyclic AMP phosphodiesterase CpdA
MEPKQKESGRPRPQRVLHISDMHVQAALNADKGFAAALVHAAKHVPDIDWVLNTGDCVYQGMNVDHATTARNWALWRDVMKAHCPWPAEHVVGNHDIYGWGLRGDGVKPDGPDYGKKWALRELGLTAASRVFDRAGWRFVVLDTVQQRDDSFACRASDEDFAWFVDALKSVPAGVPVCVVTHAPILSVAAGLYMGGPEKPDGLYTPFFLQCTDAVRLSDAIADSGKVKLCLTGHTHMVDQVNYKGTTYISHGAISGNKWLGKTRGFGTTFGVVDLFPDGRFESRLIEFPWVFG